MRLLLLARSSNAGGGPRLSETIARGLIARGHQVRIVFTWIGDRSNLFHKRLADLVHEPLCYRKFDPTYPDELGQWIDVSRIDRILIDNHERMAEVAQHSLRLQQKEAKVFFIAHCEGCPSGYLEGIRDLLSGVICVSRRSARTLQPWNPTVIHNAVHPPPSTGEDVRAHLVIPPEAFVVGCISRFDANKSGGVGPNPRHILFDALHGNDWHVLLAGKDAPRPPAELPWGAEEKSRIHTWPHEVENVGDWYRALDVFVLPSLTEGFPLSPMEAILAGTRVAMTPTSDYPDIFGDAIGFFEHGDALAMRRAIVEAPNPKHGRRVIEEKLSVRGMIDRWEEVFDDH